MKAAHLITGGDRGGARTHVLTLLRELKESALVLLLCLGDGPVASGAAALDVPCRVLPGGFGAGLRQVGRILREEDVTILHCHGARANLTGALLRSRLDIPVISTVHSDPRLDYLGRPGASLVRGGLNRWALGRMDGLVCVSRAMAKLCRDRGASRVWPIFNGMDFSEPRRALSPADRARVLGFAPGPGESVLGTAARLDPVKDLSTLLRGFAAARTRDRLWLVIAGDGPEEKKLRDLAARLGIGDRVIFPGWVEDTDSFYAALDMAVLTSLSETFPYALTMAARYGLPAVSTAAGGVPELITDGVTGLLVPVGDAAALGAALDRLTADPALGRALGAALRDRAQREFSLAAMARRQREIYDEILRSRKNP